MAKHVTMRYPTELHEALDQALATGEGIPEAARAFMSSAEAHPVTVFHGPEGSRFRINEGHPITLMWPLRRPDGLISIPARLRWYAGEKLTEVIGTDEQARDLITRLEEILNDRVESTPSGPDAGSGDDPGT